MLVFVGSDMSTASLKSKGMQLRGERTFGQGGIDDELLQKKMSDDEVYY